MMMSVAIDCAVPGLAGELAARGLTLAHDGMALLTRDRARIAEGRTVILLADTSCQVVPALDAGAADVVLAAAGAGEIAARIAARLRMATSGVRVGELAIDPLRRRATLGTRALVLMPREFDLLLHLAQNAGRTLSRAALLDAVWGLAFDPGTNVVAVHVSRLRAKLRQGGMAPLLHTDKGAGYRLSPA